MCQKSGNDSRFSTLRQKLDRESPLPPPGEEFANSIWSRMDNLDSLAYQNSLTILDCDLSIENNLIFASMNKLGAP